MAQEILPTDENLSQKQLAWGEWWLHHKHQVRAVAVLMFGVFGVSLTLYGAWGFLDWYFGSGVRERQQIAVLTQNLTDYEYFREVHAPVGLETSPVLVIDGSEGRYDLYSTITNANDEWWVEFTYTFRGAGLDGELFEGIVLPLEQRALRSLSVPVSSRPRAELVISDVRWHRIDHHVVQPDYETWAAERMDMRFSNMEYVPAAENDPLGVNKARFTARNATGYGYHQLTFLVLLYSGTRIVGVNQVLGSDFGAAESREMEAVWFNDLPNVTSVDVIPEANLLDPRTFIGPRS